MPSQDRPLLQDAALARSSHEDGIQRDGMTVVVFGDQWDDRWRRRQQFARCVARTTGVDHLVYVEYPLPLTSLARFLLRCADADGHHRWNRRFAIGPSWPTLDRAVTVLTPVNHLRPFSMGAWILAAHRRLLRPWLQGRGSLRVCVTHPFYPESFYRELGLRVDLYDKTEDFSRLYGLSQRQRRRVLETDAGLSRAARRVLCSSRAMISGVQGGNDQVEFVPNGVDWDMFSGPSEDMGLRNLLALPRNAVLLGYLGNVNARFDWSLMSDVLRRRPEWHLVIAGDIRRSVPAKQVHWLGPLSLSQAPGFLHSVNVCVLPHIIDELTCSMSPQKLYDYLASGRPIVSTPHPQARELGRCVAVCETAADFVLAVESRLSEDTDAVERHQLAEKCSWARRFEGPLLDFLDRSVATETRPTMEIRKESPA